MPAREKQKTRNLEFDFLVTLVFDFVFDSPLTQVEKLEYFRFRECISVRRQWFLDDHRLCHQSQILLGLPQVSLLLFSSYRTTRDVTKEECFREQKLSTLILEIGRAHV